MMEWIDDIRKWLFRKWGNWEVYHEETVSSFSYIPSEKQHWGRITTLRKVSNDGLIKYKVIKNFKGEF